MLPIAVLAGQVGGETCLAFPGSGLLNAFDLLDATGESVGSAHKSDCGLNGAPMIARCHKARPLFVRASDLGSLDDKFDVGHEGGVEGRLGVAKEMVELWPEQAMGALYKTAQDSQIPAPCRSLW